MSEKPDSIEIIESPSTIYAYVITRVASMFVNLKINKMNEILISCSQIML